MRLKSICKGFIWLLVAEAPVFARFSEEDAEQIDQDFNLNTETWNDKNSYRWSLRWRKSWEDHDVGYRVSAGSLNMTRFNYEENIKLDPIRLEPVSISFEQHREEDYVERQMERELCLGFRVVEPLRLLVLGDTSSLKEYGDLGLGMRLFENERHQTDVYYWSQDHYYNEKNHENGAQRSDATRTWGARSFRRASAGEFGWEMRAENDLPVIWISPSLGRYEYERLKIEGRVDYRATEQNTWYASFLRDMKGEGFTAITDSSSFMKMHRDAAHWEIGWERAAEEDVTFGLQSIRRRTTWSQGGDEEIRRTWSESLPPSESLRKEWGAFATYDFALWPKTRFLEGVYFNQVTIDEAQSHWDQHEIKLQTAMSWALSPKANFGLNATWDVDQLIRDTGEDKYLFRPWGGGNIQAQILF